jgi:carboxyl-terminal processing protease
LDYAHRKEDGSVDKFADSLKAEFKTKNGRKVYDGGGLDPDVEVRQDILGPVAEVLINSGLTFEYASKYCAENPAEPDFKSFKLSDKDYQDFITWVREQKFQYTTSLERSTKDLMEAARRERFYPELEGELTSLRRKIEANKANDLLRFKDEISTLLEEQIAFHYALIQGQSEISISRDREVQEARRVLNDPALYKKILQPQEWH